MKTDIVIEQIQTLRYLAKRELKQKQNILTQLTKILNEVQEHDELSEEQIKELNKRIDVLYPALFKIATFGCWRNE